VCCERMSQAQGEISSMAWINKHKWLIYGGLSGGISRTLTAPLERLKVLNQIQHMDASGPRYTGVWSSLKRILHEEGFRAYWKGNGTNIIRIVPSDATRFYSYNVYKKMMGGERDNLTAEIRVVAGALAGATSTLATYPLDLVRSRLSAQTLPNASTLLKTRYDGVVHCLTSIVREEGFLGLYKGMGISILGIAPYVAINFASYETIKQFFVNQDIKPGVLGGVVIGGTSGTLAVTCTYPSDVLRRRFMMQGIGGERTIYYTSLWDAIVKMWKFEGLAAFFRGLVPAYLKVVPSTAVSWGTIELCQRIGGS